jgi:hypothetical protein
MRVFATNTDVYLSNPISLSLGHLVDQIKFTRLFEKPWVCLNVSEYKTTATINITNQTEVRIHVILVKEFTTF